MKTICKHDYPADLCGTCNPPAEKASCSPSSLTPETNELADRLYKDGIRMREITMLNHARKMERERNALRCEIVTLRVAAQGVIDRWDTPLWKDAPATAKYINRLRSALSENADVDAPPRKTLNQTEG